MRLCLTSCVLSLLAFAAPLGAQATVVPTDVQMPGTQPNEVSELLGPTACDGCHGSYDLSVEPLHGWRGSMMSQASRDPVFWAAVAVAEQDFTGSADFCLRCHIPTGWLDGRSTPTDGSAMLDTDAHGVACDFCHRATNPDTSEWLGVQNPPFLAHDDSMPPQGFFGSGQYVTQIDSLPRLGPYDDAATPHDWLQSQFHRQSQLCGTCHDVSNPFVGDLAPKNGSMTPLDPADFSGVVGAPVADKAAFNNFPFEYGIVERTFSEHQASAFATMPVSDYTTLPAELQDGRLRVAYEAAVAASPDANYVDGTTRLYSCQSCHMPPVTGKGCALPQAPERTDLPLHDLTGANTFTPGAIEYLDGLGKLVVGGGQAANVYNALDDGVARARQNLIEAGALSVNGNELTLVNLTGHKLITGYPEGRRMWLNIKWYDEFDVLLREDGEYGEITADIDGQPTQVETLLDLHDENTRIYEMRNGVSQPWAVKLIAEGVPASLPLIYDRETGLPETTLADAAALDPTRAAETFHFVLNDTVMSDNRIPPYGFRVDDALARNALPVPATLYGNPGPGGVYDHKDVFTLSPPRGAVRATIDLLFQPMTWEYVQFLHEANDGSVTFLASTGADLLDAWLNTGMAPPELMASIEWTDTPWMELGNGLAGTHGIPQFVGTGDLLGGDPIGLSLTGALENSTAFLVVGLTQLNAPFKGGTLVPDLDVAGFPLALPTGPTGDIPINATWPAGIPSGFVTYYQYWVQDVAGPVGFSASNALSSTTP